MPPAIKPTESAAALDRKECPFCAEIIQAKALKCMHCGEFLDQRSRPATSSSTPKLNLAAIAARQRILILWILAGAVLLMVPILPIEFGLLILLIYVIGSVIVSMSLGLACYEEKVVGVLFALLTLVPLLGYIFLLVLNSKATSILKSNGYKVGLMGAVPPSDVPPQTFPFKCNNCGIELDRIEPSKSGKYYCSKACKAGIQKPIEFANEPDESEAKKSFAQAKELLNSGNKELAVEVLRDIVKRFPDSSFAASARRSLGIKN